MQNRGVVCDTRCQLFYNEIAKKEHELRAKWFAKNQQRLLDNLKSEKLTRKAKLLIKNVKDRQAEKLQEKVTNVYHSILYLE